MGEVHGGAMTANDRGLVAITGANGTIGYATVIRALRDGYHVRCIVRGEDAVSTVQAGPSIQQYANRIDYALVPDNTVVGAYDSTLQGVDYVIHIAGVWPQPNYDPDTDIYNPFVKSMHNILSAATRAGSVRRIIFTQAGAALVNPDDGDTLGTAMSKPLNEFVPVDPQSVCLRPPLASPHHAYCGAKAHCMSYLKSLRASGSLPYSVVQVIPGTVIGPSELLDSAPKALSKLDRMSRALLFSEGKPRYAFGFVHVEDCAAVHIAALNESVVHDKSIPDWFIAAATIEGGQNGKDMWKEVAEDLENEFKGEIEKGIFKIGRECIPINMPFHVDSRLTERILLGEVHFKTFAECVKDVGKWYKKLLDGGAEK